MSDSGGIAFRNRLRLKVCNVRIPMHSAFVLDALSICEKASFFGKTNPKIRKYVLLKAVKIKNSEHIAVFLLFFNVFKCSGI